MQLEIEYTYDVRNYGTTTIEYSPLTADETFHNPMLTYLEYRTTSAQGCAFDNLAPYISIEKDSRVCTVGTGLPKVSLAPIRQDGNARCSVLWEPTLNMPYEYTDATAFASAAVGLTIYVDQLPEGFTFSVSAPSDCVHGRPDVGF